MELRNNREVNQWLAPRLQIIVEEILSGIEELNDKKIEAIVYDAINPMAYERTPENKNFKSAWGSQNIKNSNSINGCKAEGEFAYQPQNMMLNSENYQHGNAYSLYPNANDARWYLADIIYEGLAGDYFGSGAWTHKRDAWTALKKAIGKTRMRQWIKNGAKKAGLKIKFN